MAKKNEAFKKFRRTGFGKKRRKTTDDFEAPEFEATGFDFSDQEEDRLRSILGDADLAKRVRKLQLTYPNGTLPELVAMDWLLRHNKQFEYQRPFLGGRSIGGARGAVLDFVLLDSQPIVWRVQGNFYHTMEGRPQLDETQKVLILANPINGQRVAAVVDVWENRILSKTLREETLTNAEHGIEMGQ